MTDSPEADSPGSNPTRPATAFEWVGGEQRVREWVDRFYDLMELEPAYKELREIHPPDLQGSRDKLFWFMCGWLGGPQHFVERFGHPRLRARHMPFSIGIRERDQWLACMDQAMADMGFEPELIKRMRESLFNTADWMRNRGA